MSLHELVRVGHQYGMKPRPLSSSSRDCRPTPVRVALYRPGEFEPYAVLDVATYLTYPYQAAKTDKETGQETREATEAELILCVVVPEGTT